MDDDDTSRSSISTETLKALNFCESEIHDQATIISTNIHDQNSCHKKKNNSEINPSQATISNCNSITLIEKYHNTSYLDGKYFTVTEEIIENNHVVVMAQCQNCSAKFKILPTVSSNLKRHLKRKHEEKYDEYNNYINAKKLKKEEENSIFKATCTFSQKKFEKNVIDMLIDNQLSCRLVETDSFRKIFDDLEIKCGKRSLKHFSRYKADSIMSVNFLQQMTEIKNEISKVQYVCLTADVWTGSSRRFLGVTCHWIHETDFQRRSAVLACKRVNGTHNFTNLGKALEDIQKEFSLTEEQVVATVTDNGSNFAKAFIEFGLSDFELFLINTENSLEEKNDFEVSSEASDLNNNDIEMESDDSISVVNDESDEAVENVEDYTLNNEGFYMIKLSHHIRCASHTLNLIATTDTSRILNQAVSLKSIHKRVISKCEVIWKSIRSPKKRESLNEYLRCALKRPVVTRWNSMYDCLSQVNLLKDKLMSLSFLKIINLPRLFEAKDFEYISEYLEVFKPLSIAIDILQGQKNVSYGYVLPTLLIIKQNWKSLQNGTFLKIWKPSVGSLIEQLERRFNDYFKVNNVGEFAAIAAISHPKFKMYWIDLLDDDSKEKVKSLTSYLVKPDKGPAVVESLRDTEDNFFFFNNTSNFISSITPLHSDDNELSRYLYNSSKSLSILHDYPNIKKIFLKFNTPLPSSAPVERFFNLVTLQNLPKFNRLSDENFEKRVLCKANGNRNN